MHELLDDIAVRGLPAGAQELLSQWGMLHLRTFLFVAARLTGCLLPLMQLWGHTLPRHLGMLIVVLLSLIVTPAVELVPSSGASLPPPPEQWPWTMVLEFAIGTAIGLGAALVLGSLQMAGDLIGAQMGLQPRQVLLSTSSGHSSLTGRMLLLVGMGAFLLLPPVGHNERGGALLLLDSFIGTFRSFPAGIAQLPDTLGEMVLGWLRHSVSLSLTIAAPVLACATLVSLFAEAVGRMLPETNTMLIGFPLRTVACLLVLMLVLSGSTEQIAAEVPRVFEQMHASLTLPGGG